MPQALPVSVRIVPLLLLAAGVAAVEAGGLVRDDEEVARRYFEARKEAAAAYRLRRERILPTLPSSYHAEAVAELERVTAAFVRRDIAAARDLVEEALDEYPYAECAAELLHLQLRTFAICGEIDQTRKLLLDLWERFPGYGGINTAMYEVLVVAETIQRRGLHVDLGAEDPHDAVALERTKYATAPRPLFEFLAAHGDRKDIASRADLGVARALLAAGKNNEDDLLEARVAYDDFLTRYPEHPLVFQALLEQAVSYLLSYHGAKYDAGMLFIAAGIVDQAEIYTDERPERIALIRRYRRLIRAERQRRDLFTARWYRRRGHPRPAAYYYRQVVARDAASEQALEARQELAELPPEATEPPEPLLDGEDDDATDAEGEGGDGDGR